MGKENFEVFLNVGEHPIYDSIKKFPPTGISYINLKKEKRKNLLLIYQRRKNIIRNFLAKLTSTLRIPRMFYFKTNAQLIHTSRGIIPLNKIPWVMDIEHAKSFFDDHKVLYSNRARNIVRKFIFSNFCKKLMPHCFMSKNSLLSAFGKDLEEKIEVVYPAIQKRKFSNKKKERVTIAFVANKFFEKGGKEVLEAFKIISQKYDVDLIMKCRIPERERGKYKELNRITIIEENLPYEELFEKIYSRSDIFVLPSYIDTFGFSLLEAMSVGLPVVATNIFAFPEIVEDGKGGLLIDAKKYDWSGKNGLMRPEFLLHPERRISMYFIDKPDIVRQLVEKISLLIEDSSLRNKMGRYNRMLIEKGKFSIKQRNEKLRRIYEEAIKR
jgi:glycosyltransferase involved in cell wall biosynthesis